VKLHHTQMLMKVRRMKAKVLLSCETLEKQAYLTDQKNLAKEKEELQEVQAHEQKAKTAATHQKFKCNVYSEDVDKVAEKLGQVKTMEEAASTAATLKRLQSHGTACRAEEAKLQARAFQTHIDVNRSQYAVMAARSRLVVGGCDCHHCDRRHCQICPGTFRRISSPSIDPSSLQCRCQCGCEPEPTPIATLPKGMSLYKTVLPELGSSGGGDKCAASIQYKIYKCSSPLSQVHGCFHGRPVEFSCGCDALWHEEFSIQQQLTDPGQCPPIEVMPYPTPGFAAWFRVCVLREALSPFPCLPSDANRTTSLQPAGKDITVDPVDIHLMAKAYFHHQGLNNERLGMKWLAPHKQWVENQVLPSGVACTALFISGHVYCARGPTVEVSCLLEGEMRPLKVGCGCDGALGQRRVHASMPPLVAPFCSEWMERWSMQARPALFLDITASTTCGQQAMRKCIAARADRARMARFHMRDQGFHARQKLFELEDTAHIMRGENDKVAATAAHLQQRMAQGYSYVKVPGFALPGTAVTVDSNAGCQMVCDTKGACKSYSFEHLTMACTWSTATMKYDDEYVLYIKAAPGESVESFVEIPGMKSPGDAEFEGKATLNECKLACAASPTCEAASFSEAQSQCVRSQVRVTLGTDWDYYEKVRDQSMLDDKLNEMQTRHLKQRLLLLKTLDSYKKTALHAAKAARERNRIIDAEESDVHPESYSS